MTLSAIYKTPDLHGECFVKPLKQWCKLTDEKLIGILKIGYVVHVILGVIAGIGMLVKGFSAIGFNPDAEALKGLREWRAYLQKPNGSMPETWHPKEIPGGYKTVVADTEMRVLRNEYAEADNTAIVQVINTLKRANPYRKIYISFGVHENKQAADIGLYVIAPN